MKWKSVLCRYLTINIIILNNVERCSPHFMNIPWSRSILWKCIDHMEDGGSVTTAILRVVGWTLFPSTVDCVLSTCAILVWTYSIRQATWSIGISCITWRPVDYVIKIRTEFGGAMFVKRQVMHWEKHSHTTAQIVRTLMFAAAVMSLRGILSIFMSLKWLTRH